MRKLSVKIDGKERVVEVDDSFKPVSIDGAAVDLDVIEGEPGFYVLRHGVKQSIVQIDGEGGKLTVSVRRAGKDPVIVGVEVGDARKAKVAAVAARSAGDAQAPVTIRSPIPGRVVKLLVKAGDRVTAGQTAVVLEAMKMENELRAPRAGTVVDVRCAEGTAVEAGQDLVGLR